MEVHWAWLAKVKLDATQALSDFNGRCGKTAAVLLAVVCVSSKHRFEGAARRDRRASRAARLPDKRSVGRTPTGTSDRLCGGGVDGTEYAWPAPSLFKPVHALKQEKEEEEEGSPCQPAPGGREGRELKSQSAFASAKQSGRSQRLATCVVRQSRLLNDR